MLMRNLVEVLALPIYARLAEQTARQTAVRVMTQGFTHLGIAKMSMMMLMKSSPKRSAGSMTLDMT